MDYITFNGDRRRYFNINTAGWLSTLKTKLRRVTVLGDLLDEVLRERCSGSCEALGEDLNRIVAFQHYMSE
ncbi:MAG: hypothetical protein JNK89_10295, partial [Saprospiraceae bacterium]|nr:hypothetical protein [Saprospiraceae bacterium]